MNEPQPAVPPAPRPSQLVEAVLLVSPRPTSTADLRSATGLTEEETKAALRELLERGLLIEVGTDRDAPGSPALLAVTDEFLAATGASSAEDFPALHDLVAPEELARVRERLTATDTKPAPDAETP